MTGLRVLEFKLRKVSAGPGMDHGFPGHAPPSADCDVDIEGIDLDPAADAARSFGRHQGRSAAQEGIENDIASRRAVEKGVGDQRNRLDRRVQLVEPSLLVRLGKGRRAGIVPDVGAVAAVLAELDVVAMGSPRDFEHVYELMARTIKPAHAAIFLDPDAG